MKNIVVLLVASAVFGFIGSEISFRRNAGRLQQMEARLGAIDRNLAGLIERHARLESAVDLLMKVEESLSNASGKSARQPSGFVTQLAFAEYRTKTENALHEILQALESHDDLLTQLQDDVTSLSDDVDRVTGRIAELEKE